MVVIMYIKGTVSVLWSVTLIVQFNEKQQTTMSIH